MPVDGGDESALQFAVDSMVPASRLAASLAYWESVYARKEVVTSQALVEATTNVVRNGIPLEEIARLLPFNEAPTLPNRRCLRFGTHGIHEYRGKFFPQLVRALLNVAEVEKGGLVLDPMCGSGTTIVESSSAGISALGADINPLSVLMARTKTDMLALDSDRLTEAYERLRGTLLTEQSLPTGGALSYFSSLPAADQEYLKGWFSEQVLRDLDRIMSTIQGEPAEVIRRFFTLSLSNIIRSVSWQKLDDLRVRKEVRLDEEIDPVKEFLEELGRSVRTVLAALRQRGPLRKLRYEIAEHSATDLLSRWSDFKGKVDVVVTSPPYATALPYLDTDRLSLSYLGLLTRPEQRRRDAAMIGNREITDRGRREHWDSFLANRESLPASVISLVERIDRLNSQGDVGFRRKNLSALLGRYFLDMRNVMLGCKQLLRRSGRAYFVVGNNSTTAGGTVVQIETAALLGDIAKQVGFRLEESISMEMLTSRDIFRRNAMASEVILCLRRP
ncbi:MAG: hypothetical protein HEQ38_05670 [Gemmatimonas sp.]|nr:hypothetical protein [Gemmatimonas sp.]